MGSWTGKTMAINGIIMIIGKIKIWNMSLLCLKICSLYCEENVHVCVSCACVCERERVRGVEGGREGEKSK